MESALYGIETAIDGATKAVEGISSTDTTGIETALGNINPLDADSLERMLVLAVCVAGAIAGWRKVLAALVVFIVYELFNNNSPVAPVQLFVAIVACGAVRWIINWLRGKFKKKTASTPATDPAAAAE